MSKHEVKMLNLTNSYKSLIKFSVKHQFTSVWHMLQTRFAIANLHYRL